MLEHKLLKLERKFSKFAISNLMLYIVISMGVVAVADLILTTNPNNTINLLEMLVFDREKILHGEVWRVISFLFIPPATLWIFIVLALYFFWFMGASLEDRWGSFKFNIFYFTGIIGCIAAGFVMGYATNYYLNLSLFLAFAILFPDERLLLFFIIPVKAKWLALLDGIVLLRYFIVGTNTDRVFIILSLINIIIFFGRGFVSRIYYFIRRIKYRHIKKIK